MLKKLTSVFIIMSLLLLVTPNLSHANAIEDVTDGCTEGTLPDDSELAFSFELPVDNATLANNSVATSASTTLLTNNITTTNSSISPFAIDPGCGCEVDNCLSRYYLTHSELVSALNRNDVAIGLVSLAAMPLGVALFITNNYMDPLRQIAYSGRGLYACVKPNPKYNGYNSATIVYVYPW